VTEDCLLPSVPGLTSAIGAWVDFSTDLKTMEEKGRAEHRSAAGEGDATTTGPPLRSLRPKVRTPLRRTADGDGRNEGRGPEPSFLGRH